MPSELGQVTGLDDAVGDEEVDKTVLDADPEAVVLEELLELAELETLEDVEVVISLAPQTPTLFTEAPRLDLR